MGEGEVGSSQTHRGAANRQEPPAAAREVQTPTPKQTNKKPSRTPSPTGAAQLMAAGSRQAGEDPAPG